MEQIVTSPRLQLKLVTRAEKGSEELAWLHEYRSDAKATWWSLIPRSETVENTEAIVKNFLPLDPPEQLSKRIVYTVHELRGSDDGIDTGPGKFIGLVTLKSLEANDLRLPESLGLPPPEDTSTVTAELAYGFLPDAWGKGYATESITAVLGACRAARTFWKPYEKVYVRVIVNGENPPSLRVMAKVQGVVEKGTFEVERRVWLAGKWREHHDLHIFGMYLFE